MPVSLLISSIVVAVVAFISPGTAADVSPADLPTAEDHATYAPGDGLGLAPGADDGTVPGRRPPHRTPAGGLGVAGAVLAGAVLARRSGRRRGPARPDTLFVYVPGHGGDPDGFADLADRMDISPDDVRVFDYRWAWPSNDRVDASRRAPTADAADALNAYLAALGEGDRTIYLVGHSKGGAVITEVIGRWDAHPDMAVAAVSGATLLDPPIAAGALGVVQSIGWIHPGTADDGLFNPTRCGFGGCRDIRDDLGERSGIEVVVVRNPDARFTNLPDRPSHLRIYDLDDGEGDMLSRFPNVVGMWRRMTQAHNSVLHDDTVAGCIAAEATRTGSCRWPHKPSHRTASRSRATVRWGRGNTGRGPLLR